MITQFRNSLQDKTWQTILSRHELKKSGLTGPKFWHDFKVKEGSRKSPWWLKPPPQMLSAMHQRCGLKQNVKSTLVKTSCRNIISALNTKYFVPNSQSALNFPNSCWPLQCKQVLTQTGMTERRRKQLCCNFNKECFQRVQRCSKYNGMSPNSRMMPRHPCWEALWSILGTSWALQYAVIPWFPCAFGDEIDEILVQQLHKIYLHSHWGVKHATEFDCVLRCISFKEKTSVSHAC